MKKNQHPLVLVFYMDREFFKKSLIDEFSQSINRMINTKKLNMVVFFVPTDTEERIECINPVIATDEQVNKINHLIKEIENNFGFGGKINE